MKNPWRSPAAISIVSVLAVAGCSSTQPDRIETRTSSVAFGTTAVVGIFDCWTLKQDTNGDGIPDVDYGPVCEPLIDDMTQLQVRLTRAVPWNYSLKITRIPAGGVNEEPMFSLSGQIGSSVEPLVGGVDQVPDFISLTDYDPDMPPIPDKIVGTLYYVDGHRVSAGSPIYLSTVNVDLGPPNILENSPPSFEFNLNTGDTVIVRARKKSILGSFLPADPDPEIALSGQLLVSGVTVTPQATPPSNPPTTAHYNEAGVTFSFTVR